MLKKLRTLLSVLAGKRLYVIYDKIFMNGAPRLAGRISVGFYKLIFPNVIIGNNMKCWGGIQVSKSAGSRIIIGDNAHFVSDRRRSGIALFSRIKLMAFFDSKIQIGDNVGLNGTSITCRTTSIEIGDSTMIAQNTVIMDSDFHALWPPENRIHNMGYENDRPVKIGRNVWIGTNCTILKGVTIGDNSVIGAGSIVTRSIPADVMAAGNPARVIKKLGQG